MWVGGEERGGRTLMSKRSWHRLIKPLETLRKKKEGVKVDGYAVRGGGDQGYSYLGGSWPQHGQVGKKVRGQEREKRLIM